MLRLFGFIILLFVTALFAETQEEAYYRAMKFEESGDIPAALEAFEDAVALPGPYTEEIQQIIRDYKAALGKADNNTAIADTLDSVENPWEFHVSGELGFYGMHYKATGMEDAEIGGDLFLNVNPYFDYASGAWAHSFAASVQGDYFLNNDKMTMLDTNDWNFVLGLEYSLVGKGLLLDLGYDFNIEGEKLYSDFYVWAEKDLFRFEKQRIGAVAWAYYQIAGPVSLAAYASWHRTASEGLNGTVYVGAKYEADSLYIYDIYKNVEYQADSLNNAEEEGSASYEDNAITTFDWVLRGSIGRWLGPVFRSRISYKFKNRITLEAKMNLFYGVAVDGPNDDYKKSKKFNGTWGATVSWKYWKMSYYLGLERNYKRYYMSGKAKGIYNESTTLTQLKLGVKWDI